MHHALQVIPLFTLYPKSHTFLFSLLNTFLGVLLHYASLSYTTAVSNLTEMNKRMASLNGHLTEIKEYLIYLIKSITSLNLHSCCGNDIY